MKHIYIEHHFEGPIEKCEIISESEHFIWYQHPHYRSKSRLDFEDSRVWGFSMLEALTKKKARIINKILKQQDVLIRLESELQQVDRLISET